MSDKTRILVVDDDPAWINTVEYYLSEIGYQVKVALNAQDGLELANSFKPQIVITDFMMPHMDGTDFCQHLKCAPELYPVYVIMVSAKTFSLSEINKLHIGADVYLVKPIEMSELRSHIRVGLRWIEAQTKLLQQIRQNETYRTAKIATILAETQQILTTATLTNQPATPASIQRALKLISKALQIAQQDNEAAANLSSQ